jgi:hypothetical protein
MENENASINLAALKSAIDAIFLHMTDVLGLHEIPLSQDYYAEVPEELLYAVGQAIENPSVGSLVDDLGFLNGMSRDKDEAVSLMLLHVAPLLRYLAYKVGQ